MSNKQRDRANAARERAEQMRREAEAKSRRTRTIIVAVTVVVIVALIAGVAVVVRNAMNSAAEAAKGPAGLSENGGYIGGQESAPVTVTEYLDFMCPACRQFEENYGAELDQLEGDGQVRVETVPVSILDRFSSGTEYSTRAASAAYCVMESDYDKTGDFIQAMYDNQPAENSSGLTNQEIADLAAGAGVSQAGQDCITSETYKDYATAQTEAATKAGLQGTPFIVINGEPVAQGEDFKTKLDAALAG
ncbi:MAG: DsbA family protein [Actinomycetales bacterium]